MKRIYIADVIHEQLKKEAKADGRTLQWVVEHKLTSENTPWSKNADIPTFKDPVIPVVTPEKIAGEPAAPKTDDLFGDTVVGSAELACCLNETQPCKHWVWDTALGEGYINSLSGRKMEVE